MAGEIIALITCPASESSQLARVLVEEKLAACVNCIPKVASTYFWQGTIKVDTEDLLVAKTNRAKWDKFCKRVKELHSYETPEIICLTIEDGYKPYLDWLNSTLN